MDIDKLKLKISNHELALKWCQNKMEYFMLILLNILLNLCNNSNHTLFFNAC